MTPRRLAIVAAVVFLAGLGVAPLVWHHFDFVHFWIPWQRATGGDLPWGPYALGTCNYPPALLYVFTITEAARQALGVVSESRTNVLLIKLPNLLAIGLGTFALFRAAVPRLGERRAAALAAGWACSPALFVNAAVWGQWDVLLALALLLATIALAQGRAIACGVWAGVALAMKVQAIFALPALAIGLLLVPKPAGTRWGRTIGAVALMVAVVALSFLPLAGANALPAASRAYTGSVDAYRSRSMDAWNVWGAANLIDVRLRGIPMSVADDDARVVVAGLTFRDVGIAAFGTYAAAVLAVAARRRRLDDIAAAVPLCGLAMFMLCTQMHERYGVAPAALMTLWLLWRRSWRVQAVYWSVSAAMNQAVYMWYLGYLKVPASQAGFEIVSATFMAANGAMFVWLSLLFFRGRFANADDDAIGHAFGAGRERETIAARNESDRSAQ